MQEPIKPNKTFTFNCNKDFDIDRINPTMMEVVKYYKEFVEYAQDEYGKFASNNSCLGSCVSLIDESSVQIDIDYSNYVINYSVSIEVENTSYTSEYKTYTESLANYEQFLLDQKKAKQQAIEKENEINKLKAESHRIRLEKRITEIIDSDNLSDSLKLKIITRYCNAK